MERLGVGEGCRMEVGEGRRREVGAVSGEYQRQMCCVKRCNWEIF